MIDPILWGSRPDVAQIDAANATCVSLVTNVSIPSAIVQYQVAFDAIYTPMETRLLKDAKDKGVLTVSGLEMFINQAAQQFEKFTGKEPPVELMRQVVVDDLHNTH